MFTLTIIKKILLFFLTEIKNELKWHKFQRQKNKKSDFYKNKEIFDINDIHVNKTLVSKKEKYGKYNSFKHFIGYNDNDVIKPLYLELSQMTGYINKFDKNTITMSLKVRDKKLFKNYNKIWKNIEKFMDTNFDTKPNYVNDDKYIKIKIKTYKNNITTNCYNKKGFKKVPEEIIINNINNNFRFSHLCI